MKGTRGAAALFPIILVLATSSQADEPIDETERWVPSFAITSGVVAQGASASVTTSIVTISSWDPFECRPDPCPQNITVPGRPSNWGNSTLFAPFVGGQLELMTPGLSQITGRPRGFVQVGLDLSFGAVFNTALEGDPGDMTAECTSDTTPMPPGCYTRLGILKGGIFGQGSETSLQINSPTFTAGLGVAFTSELWGRRVRFKPSFQWMRQEVEMSGRTNIPVMTSYDGQPCPTSIAGTCNTFQMISLQADKTLVWNGIGPGIEVEIDTVRAGPVVLSLAVFASAYYLLGDKDVTITASETINAIPAAQPPLDSQPVSSTYTYEQKDWSFRGGVALRFRFVGE